MRYLHVKDARHIENYRVRLEFNDGTHGLVDLSDSLDGKVFESLKNLDCFKMFRLQGNKLAWENGADFAPECLKPKSEVERV